MLDTTIKSTIKDSSSDICSISVYADKLEEGNCCETTQNGCCVAEPETAPVITTGCCGANTGKCCG